MSKVKRPVERQREILDAAIRIAHKRGYSNVTREETAYLAGCSTGTVSRLYGTMVQFRRAIVSAAIARKDYKLIAQALTAREPKAMSLPESVKREALETLI